MMFRATIMRGYVARSLEIEANNSAHARALAEAQCEPGESVKPGESAVMMLSRVAIDPSPIMPADHARNVAIGGPGPVATYRLANPYASDREPVRATSAIEAARMIALARYGTDYVGSHYEPRDDTRVVVYEARRRVGAGSVCIGRFEIERLTDNRP